MAYPGSYNTIVEQAKKEIQAGYRPVLKTGINYIKNYDMIFVGTPNWWSTIAPPIATFLENYNLTGKTVVPFCTHGRGGFGHIESDIATLDAARDALRIDSTKLSNQLSTISIREDFTTQMMNTLEDGAANLTNADLNEEGANLLMLQTRQSLGTTSLSLASQAAQSVLRLF